MTNTARQLLIVGAFLIVSALAVWGWIRHPATANGPYAATYAMPAMNVQPLADGQSAYQNGSVVNPCVASADYRTAGLPMYASRDYVRTLRARTDAAAANPPESRYADRGTADREVAHHSRSKKKSALIVGGSAGAGAAIGALAGGGKGAALGAVTGGVAGFIYDRLTHKH